VDVYTCALLPVCFSHKGVATDRFWWPCFLVVRQRGGTQLAQLLASENLDFQTQPADVLALTQQVEPSDDEMLVVDATQVRARQIRTRVAWLDTEAVAEGRSHLAAHHCIAPPPFGSHALFPSPLCMSVCWVGCRWTTARCST
jgi:hypothetical protein